jgi:hypothetical protein
MIFKYFITSLIITYLIFQRTIYFRTGKGWVRRIFGNSLCGTFRHVRLFEFYKFCLPADNFPVVSDRARWMIILFESTCVCEQSCKR